MARIKIEDLPRDLEINEKEMKNVLGGLIKTSYEDLVLSVLPQPYHKDLPPLKAAPYEAPTINYPPILRLIFQEEQTCIRGKERHDFYEMSVLDRYKTQNGINS